MEIGTVLACLGVACVLLVISYPQFRMKLIAFLCGASVIGLGGFALAAIAPATYTVSIINITKIAFTFWVLGSVSVGVVLIFKYLRSNYELVKIEANGKENYPLTSLVTDRGPMHVVVPGEYHIIDPTAYTITVSSINGEALRAFRNSCEIAATRNATICIEINSAGGYVTEALAMADLIRALDQTKAVYIRVLGHCVSSALIVLLALPRTQRICNTSARFMIHSASGGNAEWVDKYNELKAELYAKETHLSKASVTAVFDSQQDCYFTAEDALRMGFVGAIR